MSDPTLNRVAPPPIGSRWQECDNRFTRTVEVVRGFDQVEQKVRIKNVQTGRVTWARLARFSGKSGGYKHLRCSFKHDNGLSCRQWSGHLGAHII